PRTSANSGNAPSGCQLAPPSALARVWALSRPSAIQRRTSSTPMGPYSLPSPPMILNIVAFDVSLAGACRRSGWSRQAKNRRAGGNPKPEIRKERDHGLPGFYRCVRGMFEAESSADFQSAVSQDCILQTDRTCPTVQVNSTGLQIKNLRYSPAD